MSKIQIFFKLNLKTLARCLRLVLFLFPFLSLFCLLAKNGFYTWLQIAQRQQRRPKPMPMPTLTRFMRSSLVQEGAGKEEEGGSIGGLRIKSPMKNDQSWQRQIESKKKYGWNVAFSNGQMARTGWWWCWSWWRWWPASAASVWQWWMPEQARREPGQSSRAHIPRPQRVQRANEIGKYALATRKENMSSRTDGEMKNSQAEAEARTIWETIASQRSASHRYAARCFTVSKSFLCVYGLCGTKRAYEYCFPSCPAPAPACSPGQGQLLGWAAPTIYCRFDARQMNIGQTGWQQQHRRQGQRQRPAEAAQLFDFGLSVSPIFVFVFRICVCARASACACVCVWRCRCQKLKVSFSIWHSIERWSCRYRYRCIYRYVFDADTCRDIGIFTVAVARVKDMNAATDTFIDTVAHFDAYIFKLQL